MTTRTKTVQAVKVATRAGRPRAPQKERLRSTDHAFGAALVGAAKEMLAFERGQTAGQRVTVYGGTARDAVVTAAPTYSSARIAALRNRLALSQPIFALMLNVSVETVRAWEQGRRTPDGSALRLLQVAEEAPEVLVRHVTAR